MNPKSILRSTEGGGTGGGSGTPPGSLLTNPSTTPDWRTQIPEDIRADASLATIKDIPSLAKGYVNAQRLIGVDKIAKPNAKWTPEQWKAFNKEIGVPDAPDGYQMPDVKLPDGMKLDDAAMAEWRKEFIEGGMRPDQVTRVMTRYLNEVAKSHQGKLDKTKQEEALGVQELQQEYGDKYNSKVDIARSVVKKFGSETLVAKLAQTGIGNDPEFVRLFVKMGEALMDDTAGGQGQGKLGGSATQARQEINRLKSDTGFQKALNNRSDPGHKAAVAQWMDVHKVASSEE